MAKSCPSHPGLGFCFDFGSQLCNRGGEAKSVGTEILSDDKSPLATELNTEPNQPDVLSLNDEGVVQWATD